MFSVLAWGGQVTFGVACAKSARSAASAASVSRPQTSRPATTPTAPGVN
jgi:hypothetical protein